MIPECLLGLSKKQQMTNSGYRTFIKHVLHCFSTPSDYTSRMKEQK